MFFSLTLKRASWLITLVGLTAFAGIFGALVVFAPGWAGKVIPTIPQMALTAVLAAVIAQLVMSLIGIMLSRHQAREIEQIRTAIDSMAQGLCMFDATERLVVRNSQYYKMHELTPADVKPGATLSDVLARRVAKGTFSRDPQQYRREFLTSIGQGRTIAAIAADELLSSIAEIGQRLDQTAEVVRVAVGEAQVTNQDIGALARLARRRSAMSPS